MRGRSLLEDTAGHAGSVTWRLHVTHGKKCSHVTVSETVSLLPTSRRWLLVLPVAAFVWLYLSARNDIDCLFDMLKSHELVFRPTDAVVVAVDREGIPQRLLEAFRNPLNTPNHQAAIAILNPTFPREDRYQKTAELLEVVDLRELRDGIAWASEGLIPLGKDATYRHERSVLLKLEVEGFECRVVAEKWIADSGDEVGLIYCEQTGRRRDLGLQIESVKTVRGPRGSVDGVVQIRVVAQRSFPRFMQDVTCAVLF